MGTPYDFSGWCTRANVRCSDGRVIMNDAFKDCDGKTVPLVWNHQHDGPENVLGHALLRNKGNGVYAYGYFNDSESGQAAKMLVKHGDITSLSILANQLKQNGPNVVHGTIREVSLVLAGANPKAFIENVMAHSDDGADDSEVAMIHFNEPLSLEHGDAEFDLGETIDETDTAILSHAEGDTTDKKEEPNVAEAEPKKEKTIKEIINTMNEEQKEALYAVAGAAAGMDVEEDDDEDTDEGDDENVKHNLFDRNRQMVDDEILTHSDEEAIISLAKNKSCGSLQHALESYLEEGNYLAHGIDDIDSLFPEYKDVRPGAPEMITRDLGWVDIVMNRVHKSPISRIRTRQADVRGDDLRAFGYQKGKLKKNAGNIKLLKRTTDPQTVYRKDSLHRDDIVDITDFDVVNYQWQVMNQNLREELALAIMIGDGRDEGDEMKIFEDHIRPIWTDDDLYTIHADVDIAAAKAELQGTNTVANFGENYIYAEAIITAALYAREKYKGSGSLDFYCTPHLLNVMLLARDLNGRRIYDSASDLAAALNVGRIVTVEQFEGRVRTTEDLKKKKLLGLFVNLSDYSLGSTKGGQITRFSQFDIDFNQEKYLVETRVSGALTRVYSAIALEEPVAE